MDDITFDRVYDLLHHFFYDHTEAAIWLTISTIAIVTGHLMVYSMPVRRFMAVILLFAAIAAYGISLYMPEQDKAHLSQLAK